ncbi:MAG: Gfo/Idh/MocA family oxidoreductase [Candidatus Latescibacterota bacterium]|nr:Gfo/Idh/MocA family oxidoreductase [Candidatus Latescibacterota bacterium]
MAEYKAGIIGLGFIGAADQVSGDALGQEVEDLDGTHLVALDHHPQVEVVAGSSRDEGRRERFAARTGAKTYADWRELLAQEQLDIVSVATYTPVHEEITVACAAAGVQAIYCEKPVAPKVPDGERMLVACAEAGALLVFNHQRRFTASHRHLRDHIKAGGLGELTSVNAQWGNGRLGTVGTHVFDALYMLTGLKVEAVSATLDLVGKPDCRGSDFAEPGGWGTMRLEGGVMVTVDAADYSRTPWDIRINGSEGRALIGSGDIEVEYWDGRTEQWTNEGQEGSGMEVAVREIVAWLDEGTPFEYAPEEAVHVLEAIVAFHASHAKNSAWVALPLVGADREIAVNSG